MLLNVKFGIYGVLAIVLILTILISSCKSYITNNGKIKKQEDFSMETKDFLKEIFTDIDPSKLRDYHSHIIGTVKNGNFVNPEMQTWLHPIKHIKFIAYKMCSRIKTMENGDEEFVTHFKKLINNIDKNAKFHILAFDKFYEKDGGANLAKSGFHVSNEHVYQLSQKNPNIFVPVVSIHPYRKDALEKLDYWANKGVRYIKWLPNAMGFDPSDKDIIPFYKQVAKNKMIILSHTGFEAAVDGADYQEYGNPLRLRTALDCGAKIIMAHCASYGKAIDLDSKDKKKIETFDLFLRMMDNPKYKDLLFADISAITLANRDPRILETLLSRKDLHPRLVNGSDYPLPSINPLIQTRRLLNDGFITKKDRIILNEIFESNPLLFDYAVKRALKHPKTKEEFSPIIFQNEI